MAETQNYYKYKFGLNGVIVTDVEYDELAKQLISLAKKLGTTTEVNSISLHWCTEDDHLHSCVYNRDGSPVRNQMVDVSSEET